MRCLKTVKLAQNYLLSARLKAGISSRCALLTFLLVKALLVLSVNTPAHATPWAEPEDPYLRASLQVLADHGILKGPVNTFPVMWNDVARDLQGVSVERLIGEAAFAYLRVRSALEFNQNDRIRTARISGNTDRERVRGFGDQHHESAAMRSSAEFQGNHLAGRLTTTLRSGKDDSHTVAFDGSYFAAIAGNWTFSVDQIPVWWGPGQDQSLVLSTNARPLQAVRLTRLGNDAAQLPVLEWLGNWHATMFVGRTQSGSEFRNARILGARFSFKPHTRIEIGTSYTAQWGGSDAVAENRGTYDSGWDPFSDVVLGKSNESVRNRMAAVDARVSLTPQISLWGEVANKDRTTSTASWLAGADYRWGSVDRLQKVFVEYVDTSSACGDSSVNQWECIYYDDQDAEGYRRWGRSMGASYDSDAQALVLGYSEQHGRGSGWEFSLRNMRLGAHNWHARQQYQLTGSQQLERTQVGVQYQFPLGDTLVRLGAHAWYDDPDGWTTSYDGAFTLSWETRW